MFNRPDNTDLDGPAFARNVERLLWHLGYTSVTNVDGAGDKGADLVADRHGQRWVFQCKERRSAAVTETAIEEVLNALKEYGAARAAVVTNSTFTAQARSTAANLLRLTGVDIGLWNSNDLLDLWRDEHCLDCFNKPELRPYQVDAYAALTHDLQTKRKALLVLATGLGKTVVAGTCIEWFLARKPAASVLVVTEAKELIRQLERAMWRHLSKSVPTQQLTGDEKPSFLNGVTCGTTRTVITHVRNGWRPDFIFVDEAHHVGEDSQLAEILKLCENAYALGATATPWRGDLSNIEHHFDGISYRLGIEDGMRLGFLCDVRYRVFVDNVDWDFVRSASHKRYSIRQLNSLLFLPQRDERIRDELLTVWNATRNPRGIVFCQSIDHAERMKALLAGVPAWHHAAVLHNGIHKRQQQLTMMRFRSGDIPLLIAVDILNEGVDVPDVNIVCFTRVTHSRRIFVQQLGRGLRLSPGKDYVTVLDFVSDVRRIAATVKLKKSTVQDIDEVYLPSSHSITFEDAGVESLMQEWLLDAADLDTAADEAMLNFPDCLG
jgi:superfamily II DNA or RNA helicase